MAEIKNSLGNIGGGFFDQDNIDIVKNIQVLSSLSNTIDIAEEINNLPQFIVNEKQSLWIDVSFVESLTEFPIVEKIEKWKIINIGKGTYGVGGTSLTYNNLYYITTTNFSTEDIENQETTQTIDLGDITGQTISQSVNTQNPLLDIQDLDDGYVLFKTIQNDISISYIFKLNGGLYGLGGLQTTEDDFQAIPNSSLQGLQSVLDIESEATIAGQFKIISDITDLRSNNIIYLESGGNSIEASSANGIALRGNTKRILIDASGTGIDLNSSDIKIQPTPITDNTVSKGLSRRISDGKLIEYDITDGTTDLSYSASAIDGTVNSSTGTSAIIPLADATNAGLLKPDKFSTLELTTGTNSGDETTSSIQTKRPLKTIEGQSLEGAGNIDLTKSDVGLGNVDNTSDINKPVSTAQSTAINAKVADAINDGTTTIAPSQNAVFDALALKENIANKQNSRTVDGTGVKYPTIDILNSSFTPYDVIYPRIMYDQFFKYQANGSGLDITGATTPATIGTVNNGSIVYGVNPLQVIVNTRKYVTANTAGSSCGLREGSYNRINVNQGYYLSQRIKNADVSTISDVRCMYGLATTAAMGNSDPSVYGGNLIGFGADSADTNMQLIYKLDSMPASKVNLGSSFLKTSNDDYFMELWKIQGSGITFYKITNFTNGAVQQGSVTHNGILTLYNNRNNGASAIVAGLDFVKSTLHLSEQY